MKYLATVVMFFFVTILLSAVAGYFYYCIDWSMFSVMCTFEYCLGVGLTFFSEYYCDYERQTRIDEFVQSNGEKRTTYICKMIECFIDEVT